MTDVVSAVVERSDLVMLHHVEVALQVKVSDGEGTMAGIWKARRAWSVNGMERHAAGDIATEQKGKQSVKETTMTQ